MNCIIVEDEHRALNHLENQLALSGYEVNILGRLDSVEDTVSWLRNNHTDLIFLDIQLGDGIGFEIFDNVEVKTPVIFTTSYDEYITKAFEINSISYLLKPVNLELLRSALGKFSSLYNDESPLNNKILSLKQGYQKRFLIQSGSYMQIIPVEEVAYLRVQNKRSLILTTKNKQQHLFDNTLEIIEKRLDPERFFRLNRQFIVNIDAIHKMLQLNNRRIKIEIVPECKEEIIVSTEKAAAFKHWIDQ